LSIGLPYYQANPPANNVYLVFHFHIHTSSEVASRRQPTKLGGAECQLSALIYLLDFRLDFICELDAELVGDFKPCLDDGFAQTPTCSSLRYSHRACRTI